MSQDNGFLKTTIGFRTKFIHPDFLILAYKVLDSQGRQVQTADKMTGFDCAWGKQYCRKRRILWLPDSFTFPTMFSMACSVRFVQDFVVKGKLLITSNFHLTGFVNESVKKIVGGGYLHIFIANFHGHALSAVSLINKSMKNSMSTVKVREFPEFGEL